MAINTSPVLSDASTLVNPQTELVSGLQGYEHNSSMSSLPRDRIFIQVECIHAYPSTEESFTIVVVQEELCLDRIIRGRIVLCLSQPLLAKRIIVSVNATRSVFLKDKSLVRNSGRHHEETVWNRVTGVWKGDIIPANIQFDLPFSVPVPSSLPPSLRVTGSSFTYTVKVYTSAGIFHRGSCGMPLISQTVFVNVPSPIPLKHLEHRPSQTLHYAYPVSARLSVHFTIPTVARQSLGAGEMDSFPVAVHFTSHPPGAPLPESLSFEWMLVQHVRFTFQPVLCQPASFQHFHSTIPLVNGRECISVNVQKATATKLFHIPLTNPFIIAGDMHSRLVGITHSLEVAVARPRGSGCWKPVKKYKNDKKKWNVCVPVKIVGCTKGDIYHSSER